jgi:hypothetical protein
MWVFSPQLAYFFGKREQTVENGHVKQSVAESQMPELKELRVTEQVGEASIPLYIS